VKYHRFLTDKVLGGLKRSPAVLLVGARQSGKSFLMKLMAKETGAHYVTFDNLPTLATAHHDPVGYIRAVQKPVILDEIQRVPELFLPIKEDIDNNRIAGRYAMTGSANPMVVPDLGDSLAGRMLLYELYPLSQGEIAGKKEKFLEKIFDENPTFSPSIPFNKTDLIERITRGGYPEIQELKTHDERTEWADAYLSLILQKDIQDLAHIEGISLLPNLLVTMAAQVGSLLDYGNLAKGSGIAMTTLRRYMQLLHSLFIIHTLPAWSRNLKKRLMKSPKVFFIDSMILLHLLNIDAARLKESPQILGKAAENFVILELLKQTTWSPKKINLFQFHTEAHQEIDLILEDERGKVVGIEIKSSETISADDFKHFKVLKEEIGDSFLRGIVLYAGHQTLPFGPNLWAMPIAALWD
jgi:predicted AAA+ superfamily ATPase